MKTGVPKILPSLLLAAVIAAAGCGYRLGSGPADVPGGVASIAVPVFDNMTREPELGAALAEAVREEILRRRIVSLEPENRAEAVLIGVAEEVILEPLSFDDNGFTTAYRVRLKVSVRLIRRGEIIWSADHIERDEQYILTDLPLDNAVRREHVLFKIAQDIAEQIHTMMLEGF